MKRLQKLAATLFVATAFFMPAPASAVPVDLELLLLADVSGSLDNTDFTLQRDGYAAAFQNAGIVSQIENGAIGSIAVQLVYWSDAQAVAVPWTLISDAASSNAFAAAVTAAPRPFAGGTGMTAALTAGTPMFTDNGYEGTRLVIDVSGDGSESNVCSFSNPLCVPLQKARDNALGSGIDTINALWIDDRDFFGDDPQDIIDAVLYGQNNVIGGPGAFSGIAQDFQSFAPAILSKIERELGPPIPEPSTFILLGLGIAGLGYARRRFKK